MKKLLKYFTPTLVFLLLASIAYAASIVTVPQGGTGASSFPVKRIIISNGTKSTGTLTTLAPGTDGQCLIASSTTSTGLTWDSCSTGGTGLSNLNGMTGSTQTFATGTATGIGLNIVSSGNVHTFTPTVSSGYSIPLTASTTQWNYFASTSTIRGLLSASAPINYDNSTGAFTFSSPLAISYGGTATTSSPSASALLVGNGTNYDFTVLPSCSNATTEKLLYNSSTKQFACGTDQTAGGGSVGGSGIKDYVARWSDATNLTTGVLIDNGTVAGVNATSSNTSLWVQGSGSRNALVVASSTGTHLLTVLPSGYVGLNNSSPSYILDTYSTASSGINARIRGTGAVGLNIDASGSNDALLAFGTNSTAVWSIGYQGSNGNFNINKGSSLFNSPNFLTITNADGLLGLGTTTPLAKLAVVNIATTTVDAFDVASSSSTSFFRVKSNGNVGIGTTTPLAKLGIVGLSGNNAILDVATSTGASVLQVTVNSEVLLDPNAKLRLPASASQTLANAGQMYLDTSRGQLQFHDGTAQRVALQTRERTFTIASSTWNSYPSTTFGMGTFFATTTITGIKCWVTGGTSVAFKMNDGTNDTDTLTCGTTVTSDDGSIANAGFNTNEKRYGVVGTVTGAVDYLTVTVQEREDAQ